MLIVFSAAALLYTADTPLSIAYLQQIIKVRLIYEIGKIMINLRVILGLDNIVIKVTFGFALVMLAISIVLWLISGSSSGS